MQSFWAPLYVRLFPSHIRLCLAEKQDDENEEYDGRGEFEGPREPSPSPVKSRPSGVYAAEMSGEEGEETETELPKKITKGKGKEREKELSESAAS